MTLANMREIGVGSVAGEHLAHYPAVTWVRLTLIKVTGGGVQSDDGDD
jgi:hypothetical protein